MALWSLKGKKILIVDDFPDMRSMLRNMIIPYGADNIKQAKNGEEAIDILASGPIDIVLCDYNLGSGKDGQQVLEEAKHRKLLPYSSIFIIATAENTMDMVMGAVEYQPDSYLTKPFSKTVLQSRLQKLTEKKASLKNISNALQRQDYVETLALCNEQLKGQSKNKLDLLKLKGELLIALGKYDEAAAFYREIQVERAIPWAALGLGQAHFNQERYELAKEVFSSLIQDNPAFVAAYDWLAKVLNKEGNLAESQKILLEAAQKSPKAILRQRALAETSFLIGDLDNSESAYKRVMRIGKNSCYKSPGDYTGLARTLVQKDSPADALKVVSSLKQEFSDSQDAGIMAAVMESEIYHKQGNDELSEQALNKALEAYTNQPDSVSSDIALQMAQACFITGKTEEGNTLIKQVVRNNHESEEILARAREIFTRAGLAQEGDDLIAATKREVVELNNRGVELARGGKLEASIELFMTAAKGMPENKTINLNAAQSLIMQMQKNGADKNRLEIAKIYLDRVRNVEAANEKLQRLTATWRQLTSKS